jgi:hypothetical protein
MLLFSSLGGFGEISPSHEGVFTAIAYLLALWKRVHSFCVPLMAVQGHGFLSPLRGRQSPLTIPTSWYN